MAKFGYWTAVDQTTLGDSSVMETLTKELVIECRRRAVTAGKVLVEGTPAEMRLISSVFPSVVFTDDGGLKHECSVPDCLVVFVEVEEG